MFFAILVYSKFTQLGDTESYLVGYGANPSNWFYNSTSMMGLIAGSLGGIFGSLFANVFFVAISFYGIKYSVTRLNLTSKQLFFLLVLLSFPSFGVWTSIASKEAVMVFSLGVILGFILDFLHGRRKDTFLPLIAFYLCFIFKPQYLIGIFALFVYIFFSKKWSLKNFGKTMLLVMFFVFSGLILYLFRSQINSLSYILPTHFSLDGGSTRENIYWLKDNDVFWNAPYGMYIAFFGPTMNEALERPTHLVIWLESFLILSIFFIAVIRTICLSLFIKRLNVYFISIFLVVTLWLLFVHYPFGILNSGSAIRYRQGFYGFIVVLFYFLYIENKRRYKLMEI